MEKEWDIREGFLNLAKLSSFKNFANFAFIESSRYPERSARKTPTRYAYNAGNNCELIHMIKRIIDKIWPLCILTKLSHSIVGYSLQISPIPRKKVE